MTKKIKQQPAKKKNDELVKELEEVQYRLARALADYQNLERHLRQEMDQEIFRVKKSILEEVIEIYEVIEKMLTRNTKDNNLKLIKSQLDSLFKRWRLERVETKVGDKFNPHLEECLEVVKGDEDDKIIEVVRPGYRLGDQLLRPALVKVSKKLS